jgi:hypothetical protein
MILGLTLMIFGPFIAKHGPEYMPELLADSVGYFLHGVGALPIIRYLEPFLTLLLGE